MAISNQAAETTQTVSAGGSQLRRLQIRWFSPGGFGLVHAILSPPTSQSCPHTSGACLCVSSATSEHWLESLAPVHSHLHVALVTCE